MQKQFNGRQDFWLIGILVIMLAGAASLAITTPHVAASTAALSVNPPSAAGTATPGPTATPVLQPYPYTTPLPPPTPTILDGLYLRTITDPSTPTPCRRCAPFRVEGGTWVLNLEAGVYRLGNQATNWRTVGSFTVLGDELKLFNDPNCHLAVGTYQWLKQGSSFSLKVVEDDCGFGLRAKNLTTGSWDISADPSSAQTDPCQPASMEAAISGHWPILAECEAVAARPGPQSFCNAVSQIPAAECEALAAFYHSTGGDAWVLKKGWLETDTPCDWAGIKCTDGHVTAIALNYNDLRGSLPPQLGQLSKLQSLVLYFNELSGAIPAELGRLSNLESLVLNDNQLSGLIPLELGRLSSLKDLDLENNLLSGPIPAELGQLANLESLNLNSNELSGPIPAALGNLTRLRGLFLAGNRLSGSIPPELGQLPDLWMFNVRENQLSGPLPGKLADLPSSGYDFFKWWKDKESTQQTK